MKYIESIITTAGDLYTVGQAENDEECVVLHANMEDEGLLIFKRDLTLIGQMMLRVATKVNLQDQGPPLED